MDHAARTTSPPEHPPQRPPHGGSWVRQADGSLRLRQATQPATGRPGAPVPAAAALAPQPATPNTASRTAPAAPNTDIAEE